MAKTITPPVPETSQRAKIEDTSRYTDVRGLLTYDFVEHTYDGSNGYRDGTYLVPHPREVFYQMRCKSSYYVNPFKPVLNAMIDPVFKAEALRETSDAAFQEFLINADNAGTPLQGITKEALKYSRMHGVSFVVVEYLTEPEMATIQTEEQAILYRALPWCYVCKAQHVKEYTVNKYGGLESIVLFSSEAKDPRTMETVKIYRYWDALTWQVREYRYINGVERMTVIAEGRHGLGMLPVIAVNDFCKNRSLKQLPEPPLFDLAFLSFALFNKESLVTTLEQNQSFSILYVSGVDTPSIVAGPTNFMSLGEDAKFPPGFASPDGSHLINLVNNCDRIENRIRTLAKQNGVIGVISQQSGVAKEWDFRAEEAVLQETATAAKNLENRIHELYDLYRERATDYTITYPKSFSPTYDQERIRQAIEINGEMPPPSVKDELWKEIVSSFWRGNPDIIERLTDSIEIEMENRRQAISMTFGNAESSESNEETEGNE